MTISGPDMVLVGAVTIAAVFGLVRLETIYRHRPGDSSSEVVAKFKGAAIDFLMFLLVLVSAVLMKIRYSL